MYILYMFYICFDFNYEILIKLNVFICFRDVEKCTKWIFSNSNNEEIDNKGNINIIKS